MQKQSKSRQANIGLLVICLFLLLFSLYILLFHPQVSYPIYPTITIIAIIALVASIIVGIAVVYALQKK